MEEFIARENIRRFEALLKSSSDADQKSSIQALLESERKHLQEILDANALQPH